MNEGRIRYTEQDGRYIIQLMGHVRYTISQGLDKLIENIATDPQARSVAVDLTEADYLDSTNLGLLARIATVSMTRFKQPPLLFSGKEEVNEILFCMGFDEVFHITEKHGVIGNSPYDITEEPASAAALLLKAHRNLCRMNERTDAAFHDIVEMLEAEIE